MNMVECKALRNIDSTIPSVGRRSKGEVFSLPKHLAEHLQDIQPPQVDILTQGQPNPKAVGASHGGPKEQPVSSLRVVPASPKKTSSTLQAGTTSGRQKRSR